MREKTHEERFWNKVTKTDSCWIWNNSKDDCGYGLVGYLGKVVRSHRVSYMMHKGGIPKGMIVMHSCDTPSCVNPDHLSLGTKADNNLDKLKKGRSGKTMKLTLEQVQEIKILYGTGGYSQRELGDKFEVHQVQISHIVTGKQRRVA